VSTRALAAILWLNLAASLLQYGDGIARFAGHPEPPWIAGPGTVALLWVAITIVLAAGWWARTHGRPWTGRMLLLAYAFLGMAVLGQYRYADPNAMPLRLHVLIWAEAAAAMALFLWVVFDSLLLPAD